MALLDLPVEIFQQILEGVVSESGLARSVRLRHVSKSFAEQVHHAICSTRLLEIRPWRMDRVNKTFFTEYLCSRYEANLQSEDTLTSVIRETLNAIVKLEGSDQNQKLQTQSLITAVVEHLGPLQIFGYLNPAGLEEMNIMPPRFYSVSRPLLSAAAVLGKKELLADAKLSELSISNEIFGFPLVCAVRSGHQELVSFFLNHFGDKPGRLDVRDALAVAAEQGDIKICKLLFTERLVELSAARPFEDAVLAAARGGHSNLIDYFARKSTHPSASQCFKSPMGGRQDLRFRIFKEAAANGRLELVQRCLRDGLIYSDSNSLLYDLHVKLSLERAASFGYAEVVQEILDAFVELFTPKPHQFLLPALSATAKYGYQGTLHVLMAFMSNASNKSEKHSIGFFEAAAATGQTRLVQFLLGPDSTVRTAHDFDKISQRALRFAAGKGYESTVRALLEAGISADDSNPQQKEHGAMVAAMIAGRSNVVDLLVKYGASKTDPSTTRYAKLFETNEYPLIELVANRDADLEGYPYPGELWYAL